ncbi:unnamed protein product [Lactuca virosa]|uniref:Uncharacterized protein n=1 Tax=Lactuca virosa TaxID=75947 RepID=A0AAU9LKY2_9ASTR|nr:unnamed protein product [Lactuca virosa]
MRSRDFVKITIIIITTLLVMTSVCSKLSNDTQLLTKWPREESHKLNKYVRKIGVFLDTVEINTGVDILSKNITQSFLKAFSKLDELKFEFVNEVGPSFMKGGEEPHKEPRASPKDVDEKKIPEGAVIHFLYDDVNTSKKLPTPSSSPKDLSPPKYPPRSSPRKNTISKITS